MSRSQEERPPSPPHNPGVRDLVSNKRQYSSPPNRAAAKRGFRGWNERGYLPHRDEPGLVQFVTFRLSDSLPSALRGEWEHLWSLEDDRERRKSLEAYLDRGRGECHLRKIPIARVVEESLRYFHGQRYELRAWCIMPNHVHVLFRVDSIPMAKIVESWKKHTALKINKLLKRKGKFWETDYWDTYMRDSEHEQKSVKYIENNPTKAKLVINPKDWAWSSARHRDELGKLRLIPQSGTQPRSVA